MDFNPPALSQATLEELVIAISHLVTEDGLKINLHPEDVLQGWVYAQIPRPGWVPFRRQVSAETLAREQEQRARLEAKLAGRERKPMDYDDIGIPHLRED